MADSPLNVYLRSVRALVADAETNLPRLEREVFLDILERTIHAERQVVSFETDLGLQGRPERTDGGS